MYLSMYQSDRDSGVLIFTDMFQGRSQYTWEVVLIFSLTCLFIALQLSSTSLLELSKIDMNNWIELQ